MPVATINGLKHYYEETGSGPALIMLHGAAGTHHQWDEHTPAIAERYRVIAPDMRGMGRSEHVRDMPPSGWVDDVKALADELGLERFYICGSSLGSRVAMRFTLTYPQYVRALIVDGPLIAISDSKNEELNRHFQDPSSFGPNQQAENRERHGDDWADVIHNYFNIRNKPDLQEFLNVRDDVHGIDVPTLVMHGDVDDVVHPLADVFEIFGSVPRARLAIVPMIGYSVNRSGGGDFSRIVMRFLDAVESGTEIQSAFAASDSVREAFLGLGAAARASSV